MSRDVDCQFEMRGGDGWPGRGPVCAWAPGKCQSWCRTNARLWTPITFGIYKDVNLGSVRSFGLHIDLLDSDLFSIAMRCASQDIHKTNMYSEVLTSMGVVDGVFGVGSVLNRQRDELNHSSIRCKLIINSLRKSINTDDDRIDQPPMDIIEHFDSWDLEECKKDGWDSSVLVIEPLDRKTQKNLIWRPESIIDALTYKKNRYGSGVMDETGVINELARSMSDSITTARMVNSRLFYLFECETKTWSYQQRKDFRDVLMFIKTYNPHYISAINDMNDGFKITPLGPKMHCHTGNVHVTVKRPPPDSEITWGSSIATFIYTNLNTPDPSPIKFIEITSW